MAVGACLQVQNRKNYATTVLGYGQRRTVSTVTELPVLMETASSFRLRATAKVLMSTTEANTATIGQVPRTATIAPKLSSCASSTTVTAATAAAAVFPFALSQNKVKTERLKPQFDYLKQNSFKPALSGFERILF